MNQQLNFTELFNNRNPVHLDIGCGKGRLLTTQPLGPNYNYLGIEKRHKHVVFCNQQIDRLGLNNVRLMEGYAEELLSEVIPEHSIDQVSILFPDPWHKRRHLKRRLVQVDFLQQLHRVLKPGALVWLASDHKDYFRYIALEFAESQLFQEDPAYLPPPALTHFEIKYTLQSRPIHRAAFRAKSDAKLDLDQLKR